MKFLTNQKESVLRILLFILAAALTLCAWQNRTPATDGQQMNVAGTNSQWPNFISRGEHEKDVEGV
ncbi:MAG TPA: hypothetical protein VIQ24_11070, partial [Pyrinomonadaceae bacterium]